MMDLEKYIRENREAIDTETPPEGSEDRFLSRLEDNVSARTGKRLLFRILTMTAAAAVLAIVTLTLKNGRFRGTGNEPEAVYARYLAEMEDIWETVGPDEDASLLLAMVTDEAIPMASQLPEELTPRERAGILREYYGTLLDKAEIIRKSINK